MYDISRLRVKHTTFRKLAIFVLDMPTIFVNIVIQKFNIEF